MAESILTLGFGPDTEDILLLGFHADNQFPGGGGPTNPTFDISVIGGAWVTVQIHGGARLSVGAKFNIEADGTADHIVVERS